MCRLRPVLWTVGALVEPGDSSRKPAGISDQLVAASMSSHQKWEGPAEVESLHRVSAVQRCFLHSEKELWIPGTVEIPKVQVTFDVP
ncbi:unnamed protein product [Somion occarium]|uniref:Uncharacterized protein n=1 Tax=Somion occarium TaxID=3059160 RepID=A0ABP1DY27_9APHY